MTETRDQIATLSLHTVLNVQLNIISKMFSNNRMLIFLQISFNVSRFTDFSFLHCKPQDSQERMHVNHTHAQSSCGGAVPQKTRGEKKNRRSRRGKFKGLILQTQAHKKESM